MAINEKVVGNILLFTGVLIILLSGLSVYLVFSKRVEPVQFFTLGGMPIELPQAGQDISKSTTGEGNTLNIPMGVVEDPLNSFAHLVLMMFIGGVGFKIASIGTMLVRPVVVKLKSKEGSK